MRYNEKEENECNYPFISHNHNFKVFHFFFFSVNYKKKKNDLFFYHKKNHKKINPENGTKKSK